MLGAWCLPYPTPQGCHVLNHPSSDDVLKLLAKISETAPRHVEDQLLPMLFAAPPPPRASSANCGNAERSWLRKPAGVTASVVWDMLVSRVRREVGSGGSSGALWGAVEGLDEEIRREGGRDALECLLELGDGAHGLDGGVHVACVAEVDESDWEGQLRPMSVCTRDVKKEKTDSLRELRVVHVCEQRAVRVRRGTAQSAPVGYAPSRKSVRVIIWRHSNCEG